MVGVLGPETRDHFKASIILLERNSYLQDVGAGLNNFQDSMDLQVISLFL